MSTRCASLIHNPAMSTDKKTKGKGKDKGKDGKGKDNGKGKESKDGKGKDKGKDKGKGKGKGKGKDNQGMGMPEVRPTLSEVTKLLEAEELVVERVLKWQEGVDHHLHNHSSILIGLGERLDKDMNHLKGNLNHLKGNQELLMAQVQQLAVKMARQAMLMEHVVAGQGQLEHMVERWLERIDQRRRDEEHDEALERAMNSRGS